MVVSPHHRHWAALGCSLVLLGTVIGCQDSQPEKFQTYEHANNKADCCAQPPEIEKEAEPQPRPPQQESPQPSPTPITSADDLTQGDPQEVPTEKIARTPLIAPLPDLDVLNLRGTPGGVSGPNGIPTVAMEPREVKLLIPEKTFDVEGPEGALRISYDDLDLLKVLNMEPVTPNAPDLFPDWLQALDGQRVRVRGFMYPPYQETDLKGFVLARDNQICCFGRDPKVYDLIRVAMRKGETTNYIQNRPFDVVGVFHIRPWVKRDKLLDLYLINDAVVISH